jgi:hypothetical protein
MCWEQLMWEAVRMWLGPRKMLETMLLAVV